MNVYSTGRRATRIVACAAFVAIMFVVVGCANQTPSIAPSVPPSAAVVALQKQANAIQPLAKSVAAKEFLQGAAALRTKESRIVYTRASDRTTITPDAFASLKPDAQTGFEKKTYGDEFYYATFYGSPVAYMRAIDVVGERGIASLNNAKILDIGYGAIGGPRMLAGAGARVSAVDVDSLLPALYRETVDQGAIAGFDGRVGNLTLFDGVYAGGTTLTKLIGGGFNVIVTKNTMKNGYMKPPAGRKALVDFGATDDVLLDTIYEALAPGGLFLIYNISGAFDPARPATDGKSPFTRDQFAKANLQVIAFEENDDAAMRAMGKSLGWETPGTDITKTFFSLYTLVQRK
jgi:hypothetical protein